MKKHIPYVITLSLFLSLDLGSAQAACVDGAQCVITDGSEVTQTGGHFSSTDDTDSLPAIEASGAGSHLRAIGVTIDNGTDDTQGNYYNSVIYIYDGGAVTLEGASTINAYDGVNVMGADSRFTMLGGIITVDNQAIYAQEGTQVNLNGVTINSQDTSSSLITIYQVQLQANNLVMNITDSYGAIALDIGYGGKDIILNKANITIEGENTTAIYFNYNDLFTQSSVAKFSQMNVNLTGEGNRGFQLNGNYDDDDLGQVQINDSQFNLSGTSARGVETGGYSDLLLDKVTITITGDPQFGYEEAIGLYAETQAKVELRNSSITVDKGEGVRVSDASTVIIDNTHITTSGHDKSNALVFYNDINLTPSGIVNRIDVKNASLVKAAQNSAISLRNMDRHNVVNVENSQIEGDRLATIYDAILTINASNAKLFGGTFINWDFWEGSAILEMNLQAGTHWQINPESNDGIGNSQVTTLSIADSHISFTAPDDAQKNDLYQTLTVGVGREFYDSPPEFAYTAGNNALISFNSYLNQGGELSNQFTDRLLINGDVSGITQVQITEMAGSPGGLTSPSGNNAAHEGISLIQVSGKAAENSFQIAGGYTTLNEQPYRYEIFAYGPDSSRGLADADQRLVGGADEHWDFRLQSAFQEKSSFFEDSAPALVPHAANYLVSPLALMQAGFMDIGTLHYRLGDIRANMAQAQNNEQGEFFLLGYNGDYHYSSNLKSNQYGYDTDFRYRAVRAGGNFYGFENERGMARFGLAASKGSLSFDPREDKAEKTGFDMWSTAAYFTQLHTSGFYVDVIAAYGGFGGDVASKARGVATKIGGHSLQASLEIGRPFDLPIFGVQGLSLEPELQFVYQRLDFSSAYDKADNFAVALGHHEQALLRMGGNLTKKFTSSPAGREVEAYFTLNYLHAFKQGGKVWLGDDFMIGGFGNHIEAGLGFNALVSGNSSLYGQAIWQERVSNAGFRGIRFNGGLRHQF